ncbi:tsukushin isoform X1 [Ornithorhynchus anatinus]|nr:tsukushin isoform X1 [Ornithorhynchus anatinus]
MPLSQCQRLPGPIQGSGTERSKSDLESMTHIRVPGGGANRSTMPWPIWLALLPLLLLLLSPPGAGAGTGAGAGAGRSCFPRCRCQVETFGLFDSFSLTQVDCSGVGAHIVPVPIPLDTTYLDLSSNQLRVINQSVLAGPGYTTLVSLDLSHNRLTHLAPATFARLRYLEALDLSHNALEALPDEAFARSPLGDLDLSHNALTEVSVGAFSSPRGQGRPLHVDLSHNRISHVSWPADRPVPNLRGLNLSGNLLQVVPDLRGLPLRFLSLDGNPVASVPGGAFAGLTDLVHLSLGRLRASPGLTAHGFGPLPSLQVLDLSGNPGLRALSAEAFRGLDSLQELDLSGTGVATLPDALLDRLPAIRSIMLAAGVRCLKVVRESQYHRQQEAAGLIRKEVLSCQERAGDAAKAPVPYAL